MSSHITKLIILLLAIHSNYFGSAITSHCYITLLSFLSLSQSTSPDIYWTGLDSYNALKVLEMFMALQELQVGHNTVLNALISA